MHRNFVLLWACVAVFRPDVSVAQDQGTEIGAADDAGKWNLTLSAVASNAAIKIVDSEIALPEGLAGADLEASLSDELAVSSTIVSGSLGYRILPFAEVFARGGLISSDTETGVTLTGTPGGPFSDLFDGPITVDRETSQEVDGYSLGLGANAGLPIAELGGASVAAYAGFQYIWNEFDETVSSEGAATSFGLIYPVSLERRNVIYRLGGSYNWISRDVEQSVTFNGEALRVRVTQEFEDPWAVEAGLGIPLGENALIGLGAWHQLSGETTILASLSYRFGKGD